MRAPARGRSCRPAVVTRTSRRDDARAVRLRLSRPSKREGKRWRFLPLLGNPGTGADQAPVVQLAGRGTHIGEKLSRRVLTGRAWYIADRIGRIHGDVWRPLARYQHSAKGIQTARVPVLRVLDQRERRAKTIDLSLDRLTRGACLGASVTVCLERSRERAQTRQPQRGVSGIGRHAN